jgi:hypothetical protein
MCVRGLSRQTPARTSVVARAGDQMTRVRENGCPLHVSSGPVVAAGATRGGIHSEEFPHSRCCSSSCTTELYSVQGGKSQTYSARYSCFPRSSTGRSAAGMERVQEVRRRGSRSPANRLLRIAHSPWILGRRPARAGSPRTTAKSQSRPHEPPGGAFIGVSRYSNPEYSTNSPP